MKKLMLIALLGATVGSAWGYTGGTTWVDSTGKTAYAGPAANSQVAGAVGALFRSFAYDEPAGVLSQLKNFEENKALEAAARNAAERNDFSALDVLGKKYSTLRVHGATLPEWIAFAKEGNVPTAFAQKS